MADKKPVRQNLHRRDELTAAEFLEMMAERNKPSNSKFGNTWVIVDGLKFQSQAEANYYGKLKMRKRAGDIKGFTRHVTWKFVYNGIFLCSYECDFVVDENDGTQTVIDVKSEATETVYAFTIKKNLMKAFYGIEVKTAK